MLGQLLQPEIEELIRNRDFRAIRDTLASLSVPDLADLITDLGETETTVVFRLLPKDTATSVFEMLEIDDQKTLLNTLKSRRVQEILEDMSPDDRTAMLEELPGEAAGRLLMMLSPEERKVAQTLLAFPEDSVGRRMTPDYIFLYPDMSVDRALTKIRTLGFDRETVYALYVVDHSHRLMGYVSLRHLVTSPLDATIESLMDARIVTVTADTDQEQAAEVLSRYDLMALPVTDARDGRLLGIVTFDDMLDVLEEEFTEDAQMQAAVVPVEKDYLSAGVWELARSRVVWLIVLLLAETGGVLILRNYEEALQTWIVLALFLPVMIATGGNTGTQAAALAIRALATGEISLKDAVPVLLRESGVSLVLSLVLGLLGFVIVYALEGAVLIGLCIGFGLAAIVTLSNLTGTLLPLLVKRLGLDPALMSGPLVTTLVDVAGLVIYLELSLRILGYK